MAMAMNSLTTKDNQPSLNLINLSNRLVLLFSTYSYQLAYYKNNNTNTISTASTSTSTNTNTTIDTITSEFTTVLTSIIQLTPIEFESIELNKYFISYNILILLEQYIIQATNNTDTNTNTAINANTASNNSINQLLYESLCCLLIKLHISNYLTLNQLNFHPYLKSILQARNSIIIQPAQAQPQHQPNQQHQYINQSQQSQYPIQSYSHHQQPYRSRSPSPNINTNTNMGPLLPPNIDPNTGLCLFAVNNGKCGTINCQMLHPSQSQFSAADLSAIKTCCPYFNRFMFTPTARNCQKNPCSYQHSIVSFNRNTTTLIIIPTNNPNQDPNINPAAAVPITQLQQDPNRLIQSKKYGTPLCLFYAKRSTCARSNKCPLLHSMNLSESDRIILNPICSYHSTYRLVPNERDCRSGVGVNKPCDYKHSVVFRRENGTLLVIPTEEYTTGE